MSASNLLPRLSFSHYFTHEELTDYVNALAASRPTLCRLSSIGKSREGRDIYLLTMLGASLPTISVPTGVQPGKSCNFGLFEGYEYQEELITLTEGARRKILGKTRQLRRAQLFPP